MFSCLWHNPLICCNYKKNKVHSYHTCSHIRDKFLMPGNINDSDTLSVCQIHPCKP